MPTLQELLSDPKRYASEILGEKVDNKFYPPLDPRRSPEYEQMMGPDLARARLMGPGAGFRNPVNKWDDRPNREGAKNPFTLDELLRIPGLFDYYMNYGRSGP